MTALAAPVPVTRADIYVFRAPISSPVVTSFGIMYDRPAVIMRLEDADGAHGWGECFCNFPTCGAEHRARLLETVLVPNLLGKAFPTPNQGLSYLARSVEVLRIQADEPGPLDQTLSCVDLALWDLAARKAGKPLHRLLGAASYTPQPAYASGINPTGVGETIVAARERGYRAFKVKIGFGEQKDLANLREACAVLQDGEQLAVDVNQGWDLPAALRMVDTLKEFPLIWIEEPLRATRPLEEWRQLAEASNIPLAGGENLRGRAAFDAAVESAFLQVLQPDICKWGGLTECRDVAASALAAGLRYCPHYLGGGVGLLASAHLLAASGGDGLLEIDCNPNPLRELLAQPFPVLKNGRLNLTDAPGVGVEPDLAAVKDFMVFHKECRA